MTQSSYRQPLITFFYIGSRTHYQFYVSLVAKRIIQHIAIQTMIREAFGQVFCLQANAQRKSDRIYLMN